MKQAELIERTVTFLVKQADPQVEILVKTKQAGNPQFAFMTPGDRLFPYYQHLRFLLSSGLAGYDSDDEVDDTELDEKGLGEGLGEKGTGTGLGEKGKGSGLDDAGKGENDAGKGETDAKKGLDDAGTGENDAKKGPDNAKKGQDDAKKGLDAAGKGSASGPDDAAALQADRRRRAQLLLASLAKQ